MKKILFIAALLTMSACVMAQRATVRLDAQTKHQKIKGFGGFVCSPQFTYNHMTNAEIKKVWGESSTVGCNIMRLYIPIGKNAWSQSLATAKLAKQMGLIVFASPWGQPAEWKTNGTSNAKNSDGTLGYLKKENWADYAQYLEDYVQYLRKNGVELDAISIQNEPDWQATYAGCMWSAADIASFVKTYGRTISCKIMAPETLSVNDNYVNALNKADVINCFDIYGGHQYGGIQSAYKNLAAKGKEIWMTEYLINWNEVEGNTRNYDFSKDFFNFFRAINTCMLGDFNAWIHYAAKRYYAMMGDGQRGAGSSGTITKRGYVMAQFAKFVTGMTRIGATFGGGLEGSAYLSQTGDTAVVVVANTSDQDVELTVDLPFYTTGTSVVATTKTKNFSTTTQLTDEETCRPVVTIPAQSVSTVLTIRCRDRQPSDMKGTSTRFDRLDDMATTKTNFGTTYKMSNKSKTFDSSNPLISSRKTLSSGYIALNDRYSQLVMHVKKVTSTSSLTDLLCECPRQREKPRVRPLGPEPGRELRHSLRPLAEDPDRRLHRTAVADLRQRVRQDGVRQLQAAEARPYAVCQVQNQFTLIIRLTFKTVHNMKKLKFLLMLLVVVLATSAKAETVKYLVLNAGGEETVVALADNPVMTISEGMLKVTVGGEEVLSASLENGLTYSFSENGTTAIEEIQNDEAPRLERGHVYISHAQQGDVVRVYTIDGKLAHSQRISDDGKADIDLTMLNKGLYIVKSAKTTIKVINK